MMKGTHLLELDNFLLAALKEDAPYGDKTTEIVLDGSPEASAYFLAKEEMVVCGVEAALRTFELIDFKADCRVLRKDGSLVKKGTKLAAVRSGAREILLGERTALNVFQRLSGIATCTRKAVEMLKGSGTKILDTRKTTPLMRRLEKYAVRTGGATNHRMGLSDGILIKDNHIEMVGSVGEAVKRARAGGGSLWKIEVEVKNLDEFRDAVKAGADVIMLDNMEDAEIRKAVRMKPFGTKIEVSGGITPRRLGTLARIGVDFVSMGALTHSAPGADISLEIVRP
ncbi:MAG TPA: carboxylating nicotinate-nucleotide diphosphorylase [Acidobacteriota bacterium]|jgi:nicotinate-nucleotide pyrophosphorylase (carboxylating)|nr:carboxylating nicotinate-nucleotide diphosphorylase [Acidobacteriota bacterium]HNT16900.1 carboxylating nicotinate-nucleotide diphosphorylase [Acidobacteriota bacterium]HPA27824.1 carboxylating nicotinate-nucleotide diphosphorylase [Acidobacteriota bacterium]HQO20686.1 carboxylating nicotinate-nucleotide diphosphorylase [Acidobacteriota bacterium]HQQ47501.1 carboxylating nicotinate-nucleotide diphosphorylase [Acidobacteriota bacterium]